MKTGSEITEFYREKSVFITGATGFLGKVLIEKLLRSCGQIKYIYVLIRSKKEKDVKTRIKDLISSQIFAELRECNPSSLDKVLPIEGDICLPNLGITNNDLMDLLTNVSLVFHSAATIKFDEPLRTAINLNVLGTQRVVQLCRQLPKLLALIYVSTAYSNCNRYEIDEIVYPSVVSHQKIIDLCEWMSDEMLDRITPKLLEGFPNTYVFSKSLSEVLLSEECQSLPVAIVRPSIVSCSWKEPVPGWVDSLNSVTPFLLASGKGIIRYMIYSGNKRSDIIPVDTVINLMIAVVWFTATKPVNSAQVYNCTSGSLNPISWGQVFDYLGPPNSIKYPSSNIYRYPNHFGIKSRFWFRICCFFDHLMPAYLFDGLMLLIGSKRFMVKTYKKLHKTMDLCEWFTSHEFRFSNNNVLNLNNRLNHIDKKLFNFDIRTLNWSTYWDDYWLGARQYVLKENHDTLPTAHRNLQIIYLRDKLIGLSIITLIAYFIYLAYTTLRIK